jgi:VanZ family protein
MFKGPTTGPAAHRQGFFSALRWGSRNVALALSTALYSECNLYWRPNQYMSHFRTALRYLFAAGTIAVMVLSAIPAQEMPSLGVSDKIEHVVAYALLGLTGGRAFTAPKATILLLVLLPMLGVALEAVQLLSPGRSSEVTDAFANWAGATLVLLPILLVRFGLARTRRSPPAPRI